MVEPDGVGAVFTRYSHAPLVASTKRPQLDADGPERVAMERLAHVSQAIAKQCGHLLRIDVVRTTKNEVPHKPITSFQVVPLGLPNPIQRAPVQ